MYGVRHTILFHQVDRHCGENEDNRNDADNNALGCFIHEKR